VLWCERLTLEGWGFTSFLQKKEERGEEADSQDSVAAARALFKLKSSRGQDAKADNDTLWTKHESAITGLSIVSPLTQDPTVIATSALDGRVVVWDLPLLDVDMGGLSI
jgi:WD40 repeat protein